MSTRRAELRAGLATILDGFHAANPTLLRQTYRARPASFHPPLAYVGGINEPTIVHEFGNRLSRPDIRSSIVLVQGIYENAETADKQDVLADALITYLAGEHSRVSGSLLEAISSEDVELAIGETNYAATVVTLRLNAVG